jgi:hypothetical protein
VDAFAAVLDDTDRAAVGEVGEDVRGRQDPAHLADRDERSGAGADRIFDAVVDLEPGEPIVQAAMANTGNPWFKRGNLYRSAVDVLRRAASPMTARQISDAPLAEKLPPLPASRRRPYRRPFLLRRGCGMERRWFEGSPARCN